MGNTTQQRVGRGYAPDAVAASHASAARGRPTQLQVREMTGTLAGTPAEPAEAK
jgi:hypothetical protein